MIAARRLAAILAADVVGLSSLKGKHKAGVATPLGRPQERDTCVQLLARLMAMGRPREASP